MTTSTPTGAAPSASPASAGGRPRRGGRLSVGNIIRSMGLLLLVVFFVVVFQQRGGNPVHVVNPTQTYIGAQREAHFPLLVPRGLSAKWRCTDARDQSPGSDLTLHLGYVTPANQYAEMVETDVARSRVFSERLASDPVGHGAVNVNGTTWIRYRSNHNNELALVRTTRAGGREVTFVVTGSASQRELTTLAASLSRYHGPG